MPARIRDLDQRGAILPAQDDLHLPSAGVASMAFWIRCPITRSSAPIGHDLTPRPRSRSTGMRLVGRLERHRLLHTRRARAARRARDVAAAAAFAGAGSSYRPSAPPSRACLPGTPDCAVLLRVATAATAGTRFFRSCTTKADMRLNDSNWRATTAHRRFLLRQIARSLAAGGLEQVVHFPVEHDRLRGSRSTTKPNRRPCRIRGTTSHACGIAQPSGILHALV